MVDLVVRGGTVVTADGSRELDVAIADGRITALGPELPGGRDEVDARGLIVLPGAIDVHLHFNEPGRTAWEGASTGSRALAAAGGTLFFDMPMNSTPAVVDEHAFDRKRTALERVSVTDFALWGGLTRDSLAAMPALADRGVVGFKAFMCDSGVPDFPRADDTVLLEGCHQARRLGLPVAVHAESEELLQALSRHIDIRDARDFAASRPVAAEIDAIRRALELAGDTGVRLHIVHVSSGRGVALAAEARRGGVDVSIETCPHYLFFTQEDMERLGAVAKCAPPLRSPAEQHGLWHAVLANEVDLVASDHSPADPALKALPFDRAWGGIAGVQSTLSVLLDRGHHARGLSLQRIAGLTATTPGRRFRIAGKGSIAVGHDADLALVALNECCTLEPRHLHQRHKLSPYCGHTFRGVVRRTVRRGETIFDAAYAVGPGMGRFVRPLRLSTRDLSVQSSHASPRASSPVVPARPALSFAAMHGATAHSDEQSSR
ncbi:MAG TPA: allantoinase AllB [Vicinamibacterales bacterium]|nr:allantoinase AllB [Vicinamibacterales bacterium]